MLLFLFSAILIAELLPQWGRETMRAWSRSGGRTVIRSFYLPASLGPGIGGVSSLEGAGTLGD